MDEAADEVLDAVENGYSCAEGCELHVFPPYSVGMFRYTPPKRAWWTLGLFYWVEGSITATCLVQCVHGDG